MRKIVLLLLSLGAIAVFAVVSALRVWGSIDTVGEGAAMSIHGWIALGLGVVFTLLIGGGLMALAFYSARTGHDDHVGEVDLERETLHIGRGRE